MILYFSGVKLALVPLVTGLAVGACAVLAAVGVVALPALGGYKLHKWRKRKKAAKERDAYRRWMAEKAEMYRQSGE